MAEGWKARLEPDAADPLPAVLVLAAVDEPCFAAFVELCVAACFPLFVEWYAVEAFACILGALGICDLGALCTCILGGLAMCILGGLGI